MSESPSTPRSLGFRMPAEWEPQEAIWFSWPHNRETWPGAFDAVPGLFAEIVQQISDSQKVRLNVANQEMVQQVQALLAEQKTNLENVSFHLNPTNDSWARDHGPIYIVRDQSNGQRQRALTNWEYNSWGDKYPPYALDNGIPERIANEFGEHLFNGDMVLEGGSIDVNGAGTLLTTTSCLLNPNRNPHLTKAQIEDRLRDYLGVSKILWLEEGIIGDDTDGHIDDITRFVSPSAVVTAIEENPEDENFLPLMQNLELLREMSDQDGHPLEIIRLPMPDPVYFQEHRLPASYANFLICNEVVLVPVYRCPQDQAALGILQDLFPARKVVGIDCTPLIWGLGAIHCISQQQPQADELFSE